jgi:hypothetical protein
LTRKPVRPIAYLARMSWICVLSRNARRFCITAIVFAAAMVLFPGCVTLYKPNTVYSPLLKERGELNVGAALGLSGGGLYNAQAAYAVTENVALMATGMYHRKQYGNDSLRDKLDIVHGEAGIGYFTTFGENKHGLFQCYGGSGYGISRDRVVPASINSPTLSADYVNIFLQPGIAYSSENFDVALDVRSNYVTLFNTHAFNYNQFDWWDSGFIIQNDTTLQFFNLEPTLTIKAGGRLKGMLQLGATVPTWHRDVYFAVNNASIFGYPLIKLSFGITYTFAFKRPE